jgi:hypothetical protein
MKKKRWFKALALRRIGQNLTLPCDARYMSGHVQDFQAQARNQASELLEAIATAESIIIGTIERECEALRTDRMLAAEALHLRLCDAARLYLHATKAARASLTIMGQLLPGISDAFEERRAAFASVLRVELAVLAAERAAAAASRRQAPAAPEPALRVAWKATPQRPAFRVVPGRREDRSVPTSSPTRLWSRR